MVNSGNKLPHVPHLAIAIEQCDLESGALKILAVIRPNWSKSAVSFKLLTEGISNKLVKCVHRDSNAENPVLIRMYGDKTDLFIDRKAETRNITFLNEYGLASRLYATFENGLAYEFIPGSTLTVKTIRCESVYKLVARHLARFHRVEVTNGPVKPLLWEKLETYLNLIPDRFSDDRKQEKFNLLLKLSKQDIVKEIAFLKETLLKLDSKVVFTHNDLLLANIIYSKDSDTVKFIDYEYAGINYQAYDIANHFAEFAGVDNVDYSYYPSRELQWRWLHIYLTAFHGHNNVSEVEICKLYDEVNQFVLASHVFWGLWALLQAEHSSIEFDFMSYAAIRFNEYFSRKVAFLTLQ